jgi:transcription elongation factor Elf1
VLRHKIHILLNEREVNRMTANIITVCPECGKQQRVTVNFKHMKTTFDDTIINCENCNVELLVTDNNHLPDDTE